MPGGKSSLLLLFSFAHVTTTFVRSPVRDSKQDDDAVLCSVLQKSFTTRKTYKKDRSRDSLDIRHNWQDLAMSEINVA